MKDQENVTATRSQTIAAQIDEAKARLAEIDSALAKIANERDLLLRRDTFDDAAMKTIEETEKSLTREREYLSQRVSLLEVEQEKAECDEAQARLAELLVLAQNRRESALSAYLNLIGLENQFVGAFKELIELYQKEQESLAESRFLAVRYGLPRIERDMERLDDPQGQFAKLREVLTYSLGHAAQHESPWTGKLRAWENAGRPSKLPRPQRVPPPPPPAPEVFKVTVPGEAEQGTVTISDLTGDGKIYDIRYNPPGRERPSVWTFSDIRACAIRGDLPGWVEQVPPLKEFVEKVRTGKPLKATA
jgi:hypothetical protein